MGPLIIGAALAAAVGLSAHVVGYDRDRSFYAVVLTIVAAFYVLFNVMAQDNDLGMEIAFFGVFAILAVIGFRTSLWFVVTGLALHGVFDFFRHSFLAGRGVPQWWPAFCGSYDVVAALGLAMLLLAGPRPALPPGAATKSTPKTSPAMEASTRRKRRG